MPAKALKVLVLSDSMRGAAPVRASVAAAPGVRVSVLITNERLEPGLVFWSRQAVQALRALINGPVHAVTALAHARITVRRLHDEPTLRWLVSEQFDIGVHDLAVIYKRASLDAFRLGVLNAHIGILPRYRGRCVMEWSLLHGEPTGVTVFFMDEGIDTGRRIVLRRGIPVWGPSLAEAKAKLWQAARGLYRDAVAQILADEERLEAVQRPQDGTRFYVISELFSGVVEGLLAGAPSPRPSDS